MGQRYGFNFQWMFSWAKGRKPVPVDEKALDLMTSWGFNFVRIPMDYRFWIKDFEYFEPDEGVLQVIDSYLKACQKRNIHLSLNLHRAPGYCINGNEIERDNLWVDKVAQDGFVYQWEMFARRYKGVSSEILSFDLVNEPPNIGQYGLTRENHADLIRLTVDAIWSIDPEREIEIDGLAGGNFPMPELSDLDVIQSGRGYQPMALSHYRARWTEGCMDLPEPVYPGVEWYGVTWDKTTLREYYRPWLELEKKGVKVHIGEFGCFNHTPNDVVIRWFKDLLSLYKEFKWGYALWNFEGPFGVIDHGRPGARYENVQGYFVDRELLNLLLENRVEE